MAASGQRAAARRTGRERPVGRVPGFQRAPFVGSRRLSKPLVFRPKIAVANFLIYARCHKRLSSYSPEDFWCQLSKVTAMGDNPWRQKRAVIKLAGKV
jgi:hypothetical protein